VVALLTEIPEVTIAVLLAFLAGGVIMNVLKEELPEERESRFWAFALWEQSSTRPSCSRCEVGSTARSKEEEPTPYSPSGRQRLSEK
jgi:hypothetical protein